MAEKKDNACVLTFDIVKALLVRGFIICHNLLTSWRLNIIFNNDYYWLFLLGNIFVVAECIYAIVKRQGKDSRGISLCFVIFLCCAIPPIWLIELNSHGLYVDSLAGANSSITVSKDVIEQGIESILSFQVRDETWIMLVEESVVYIVIVGRWFLPRGNVSREQLSVLLMAFVGVASDIMEVFALFGEDAVKLNIELNYAILAVWSLSLFQFTLKLTLSNKYLKCRDSESLKKSQKQVLKIELLNLAVSMFMQDGPFLVVRAYTMYTFKLVTYSLMFFLTKNILVVLLIIYRTIVLTCSYCTGEELGDTPDGKTRRKTTVRRRRPDHDDDTVFVLPTFVALEARQARFSDISEDESDTSATDVETAVPDMNYTSRM